MSKASRIDTLVSAAIKCLQRGERGLVISKAGLADQQCWAVGLSSRLGSPCCRAKPPKKGGIKAWRLATCLPFGHVSRPPAHTHCFLPGPGEKLDRTVSFRGMGTGNLLIALKVSGPSSPGTPLCVLAMRLPRPGTPPCGLATRLPRVASNLQSVGSIGVAQVATHAATQGAPQHPLHAQTSLLPHLTHHDAVHSEAARAAAQHE